jgi:hypothetical protein
MLCEVVDVGEVLDDLISVGGNTFEGKSLGLPGHVHTKTELLGSTQTARFLGEIVDDGCAEVVEGVC